MDSRNQPYQSLSPHNSSYCDAAYVSPSSTCSSLSSSSSSSSSSLATPEPEFDDQEARHKATQPPKPKKQYQCPQCLKSFTRPSALQTHSYTHTAEKPFQCRSPNCGRSFSVVSNLRRHFKVHQKAAVGDKLSAEDRLRCVRNLMEKSSRILANKKQILPYGAATSHPHPAHRKTAYPIPPLPQQQQRQYHPALPDLKIKNNNFILHGPHQNMFLSSGHPTTLPDSKIPIYWVDQIGTLTPCTPSTNNGAPSYGSNIPY